MNKNHNIQNFKEGVYRASDFLQSKGYKVPRSTLLHALSHFLDGKDWNTINSMLRENTTSLAEDKSINPNSINPQLFKAINDSKKCLKEHRIYAVYTNLVNHILFLQRKLESIKNKDDKELMERELVVFRKLSNYINSEDFMSGTINPLSEISQKDFNKKNMKKEVVYKDFSFYNYHNMDVYVMKVLSFIRFSCGIDFDIHKKDIELVDHSNKGIKVQSTKYVISFSIVSDDVFYVDDIFKALCWKILI